jgi:hypothetical protein
LALFYLLFLPVVHIVLRWADAVYLAIVVPMVPIGLGWIAASRLALFDEAQFRERVERPESAR